MSDEEIGDVLVRLADRYQGPPPPVEGLIAAGSRRRRRRSLGAAVAVAAMVIAIIGMAAVVTGNDKDANTDRSVRQPIERFPADSRLVGVGHAVIAVPKGWATNKTICGTPLADTVVINVTGVPTCGYGRPPRVSDVNISVRERRPNYPDFASADQVDVNGVEAWRSPLDCTNVAGSFTRPGTQPRHLCQQAMWVPAESALFIATTPRASSTQDLLDTVRVLEDRVAVPQSNLTGHAPGIRARFIRSAESLGLVVRITSRRHSGFTHGSIVGISPSTGTVVRVGSTIHLALAR